jgi:hypothetical protein
MAMKVKTSRGLNIEADNSIPRRVISPTEMTAPNDEYLISCTKFAASGGRVMRTACGSTMRTNA